VIDADAIGHKLLDDEAVADELRRAFGDGIFSAGGYVDRRALGEVVFADPGSLDKLNSILHPPVLAEVRHLLTHAQSHRDTPAIVLDAALLFEAGWDDLCSHLVFVEAPSAVRCNRAMKDRGWDEATWQAREKSQISLDKKAEKCDYKVDSSSSASCLHEQLRELFHRIVPTADHP
jgi:dephospho-CoA kinase